MAGYVYVVTNHKRGTLYIGVTSNLKRHIFEQAAIDGAVLSDTFCVKPSTGAVYDHVPEKHAHIGGELFSAALDAEATGAGAAMLPELTGARSHERARIRSRRTARHCSGRALLLRRALIFEQSATGPSRRKIKGQGSQPVGR